MNDPTQLIESFYRAFQQRDYTGMAACYHAEVHFSDPVFPDLYGDGARAMWHMLCEQGTDLVVTYREVTADTDGGSAHWEARYTFSPTGRPVHNKVEAAFGFQDGKIIRHLDTFGLWKWTRMALGAKGTLLGWLPPVQNAVRKQAAGSLKLFIEKQGLNADNVRQSASAG